MTGSNIPLTLQGMKIVERLIDQVAFHFGTRGHGGPCVAAGSASISVHSSDIPARVPAPAART